MSPIGVLALQGDWPAHGEALDAAGYPWRPVRGAGDLAGTRGLVLPGGESTAMLRLLETALVAALHALVRDGRPVLATCAGVILAARRVEPEQPSFGWLDVAVRRNGWGRQLDSFVDRDRAFIRAPRIVDVGPRCEVLDTVRGEPALVREGAVVGATFHPELGRDPSILHLTFGEPA